MRVFVTGASGYIGYAVAKAFRAKGYTVFGLVRKKEDAQRLTSNEISPFIGDLQNPDSYRQVLEEVEVVVHCAFDYASDKGVENDVKTIDTVLGAFSKNSLPRTFIYTSGVWVYGSQGYKMVDESMPLNPLEIVKWRPALEEKVLQATTDSLRTVIIRPGHVYGCGGGLTKLLFSRAQDEGVSIVGEGHNRWPMIHVQDLAHAYVSAAEKEITHAVLNVVDDSTATIREMAEAIARCCNKEGKINVVQPEEAKNQFGPLVEGLLIDLTVSNARIKRLLGWQIHHAPFIYDVDLNYKAWLITQQVQEF